MMILPLVLTAVTTLAAEPAMLYRRMDPRDRLVLADAKGVEIGTLFKGETLDESWSPDGRLVAFNQRGPAMDPDAIAVADLTGRITRPKGWSGGFFSELAWSLDGRAILFSDSYKGVIRAEIDAATQTVVCPMPPKIQVKAVFPSPDGKLLAALVIDPYGNKEEPKYPNAYLMKPDCSEPRRLSRGAGVSEHLSWSPDGKRLAWLARWAPDPARPTVLDLSKIVVAALDGLTLREFKREKYGSVSWTGEGKLLTSWSVETSSGSVAVLGVLDPDTGEASVLDKRRGTASRVFGSPQGRPRGKK